MNNKPVRRMEVVSVVGDVGITLFLVGTETATGWACGRVSLCTAAV